MKCPVCKTKIDEDEIIDVICSDIESHYQEGDLGVYKKTYIIKQRGFDLKSFQGIKANIQICPNCGCLFVSNIKENLKKGIKT